METGDFRLPAGNGHALIRFPQRQKALFLSFSLSGGIDFLHFLPLVLSIRKTRGQEERDSGSSSLDGVPCCPQLMARATGTP